MQRPWIIFQSVTLAWVKKKSCHKEIYNPVE